MSETLRPRRTVLISAFLIASLTVLVLWRKIACGQFLGDDFILLEKVSTFHLSPGALLSLGVFHIRHNTLQLATGFRPIPLALWLILYRLFGLEPSSYHLTILGLHVGNAILVYLLLRKLLQEDAALVGAYIFGVFAAHLEAVQWVSGFFDVLCAMFFLASSLLFLRFLDTKKYRWYLLSIFVAILAILSKETAITLPVILVLTFFQWNRKNGGMDRSLAPAMKLAIPYLLLFSVYLIARRIFLWNYRTVEHGLLSFFSPRAFLNVWTLLGSMVVPHHRSAVLTGLLPFIIIAFIGVVFLACTLRKHVRTGVLFGALWMIVTALPTLGFLSPAIYFQRFYYLPAVGFCSIVGQMLVIAPRAPAMRKYALIAPCLGVALYSVNAVFENRNLWMPAWTVSYEVQKSFRSDVSPALAYPAKVYLRKVPELVGTIDVFFTGLPQAFKLLTRRDAEFYLISHITAEVPPFVEDADKPIVDEGSHYYFFDWDGSQKRFKQTREAFADSGRADAARKLPWNFPKYGDLSPWEAYDLQVLFDTRTKSYSLLTTSADSFLKSPFVKGEQVKYIQITCSAADKTGVPLTGQVFWVTAEDLKYDGRKSVMFGLKNDGEPHTYSIPLYINGLSVGERIERLAFRLSDRPGTRLEIQSVVLYPY